MTERNSSFQLRCPAQSRYVAAVRHALTAFLRALDFEGQALEDVATAAGEALANTVEHAYRRVPRNVDRYVELRAMLRSRGLCVIVSDGGAFIDRPPVKGRGFGLRIIRAIAGTLRIDTSQGTTITMTFPHKR